ncbi:uncharacterized protein FSUBG_2488 [Fusarium subglutinans]|uniref:DUF3669 domain-containing protein n=1 Tax=Gibberella subglutinans TaxID=42677 RepID=A0A8H5V7L0_GIBSU|nr:uncharacterized protein FSUBG_2488 [Fusarium subglutinans]KAF5611209.1 hypothetical protein FSUBG_2488 [Fusarium subglutinans]
MADKVDAPDNTMLRAQSRLPKVVTLLTPADNTTKTDEGDSKYTISTEYDCDPRKFASYDGRSYWCLWEPRTVTEYQLTKLPSHNNSNIHTVQVGCRTYAAQLSDNPEAIKKEVQNHISVVKKMNASWREATRDFYETHEDIPTERSTGSERRNKRKLNRRSKQPDVPHQPYVPYSVCEIIRKDHEGQDIPTAGYVTSFIPPLHPATVRALVNTFVDSSIQESVKNDPNLSNVRLQVQLGMMAPPDDPLSTRLLSRPVYLDQLLCEAEKYLEIWCEQMGIALAILHWECRLDAAGVKFYLAPEKRGHTKLWMTSFGDCKPLQPGQDETKAMAKAIYDNPVWPRSPLKRNKAHGKEYWLKMRTYESFIRAYTTASENILSRDSPESIKRYPIRFNEKLAFMSSGSSPILDGIQDTLDKLKRISLKFWERKAT